MSILFLMIPMALMLSGGFLFAFLWATSSDQFEDTETPAYRMLNDELEFQETGRKMEERQ